MTARRRPTTFRLFLVSLAAFLRSVLGIAAGDPVNVPGGPASVRRLLRLDADRPAATFFRDVHEVLLFEGESQARWSDVEGRRTVVEFVRDLRGWRREFGASAVFSASSKEDKQHARRALAWLGIKVEGGSPGSWTTESRSDAEALSRRRFFAAIGIPIPVLLSKLRAGEEVVVAPRDGTVPLPLGLAAWRQILREPGLSAADAFLSFVENVRASRMLLAVDDLDAETLDGLGAVAGNGAGSIEALRFLFERALDSFSRFPEAISLDGRRFDLPGGREADPVWTDLFGASPSEPARFLRQLYERDAGKGAYVVDSLQQLPAAAARALVLGAEGSGAKSVERFRRLYRSIRAGEGIATARRDPYDFAHVAAFLPLFPEGEGASSETERRRFLFVSSLVEARPELREPGLVALLRSGVDRFFPAYAVLEDVPVGPEVARRYVTLLDRLDRRKDSRATEVVCGLFGTGAELFAQLARSNALPLPAIRDLFSAYLELSLFAGEPGSPELGATELLSWLFDRLLASLSAAAPAAAGPPEEAAKADDLLARALVGPPAPVRLEWRGGRYLFDPTTDELSRRREFREKQRLASLDDLEKIRRARAELVAAAGRGDADSARRMLVDLATHLRIADSAGAPAAGGAPNEEETAAREFVTAALRSPAGAPGALPTDLRALDALVAARGLEAMLGHVYSISAGDPEDLYYQDPDFVRRHSFRRVEKGGKVLVSSFGPTTLAPRESGGGSRVSGSVFGLPDVLGLLHAEQIPYKPGAFIGNEQIRSGLVGPIRRMSPARLDDDAMTFVAASCRTAEELAVTLEGSAERERLRTWRELARDLVPRSRLARVAKLGPGEASAYAVGEELSPTDLYRIGRRLALGSFPSSASPAAQKAREAFERLREKFGEAGARERIAEFGPRAVAYDGRLRLTDRDLPAYERLAAYRTPQLFSDRLYDWKVSVARAVAEAGLPAAVLPVVLPEGVDKMLADVRMAFAFDWRSLVRRGRAFDAREIDLLLEEALKAGRLVRDQSADPVQESE